MSERVPTADRLRRALPAALAAVWTALVAACGETPREAVPESRAAPEVHDAARSADGVRVAYSAYGSGEPALVFIPCGFCDRSVWRHQVESFRADHRVVTLDLAGHGASGRERTSWTLAAFGDDVEAVLEALEVERAVLIGNSLGGPVALEVAARLPERIVGIVAVDTLQDADAERDPEAYQRVLAAFREDFAGTCAAMVDSLLHDDADPVLAAEILELMCDPAGEALLPMLEFLVGYDQGAALGAVAAPIHGINGDLFPTDVEGNRRFAPAFEATVLEGIGHFPQLERPEEFDRLLREIVAGWIEP